MIDPVRRQVGEAAFRVEQAEDRKIACRDDQRLAVAFRCPSREARFRFHDAKITASIILETFAKFTDAAHARSRSHM
ncbi:MAG: hypothetical protein ABL982_23230, partial [Vicinamibacterales bacterium]